MTGSSSGFDRAVAALGSARRVMALSGAGISRESGVPTFREAGEGLWEKVPMEEVATPEALRRNPLRVWEFYEMRRENMKSVDPNPGHYALAQMDDLFDELTVVTQNIDGLHQRAGSRDVIEVHGSLWRVRCVDDCGHEVDPFPHPAPEIPPPCRCGSTLRPAVVLFGENLPIVEFERARRAALECDVGMSLGTSSVVWPAAGIPLVAKEGGAFVIEVNPEETELTAHFDVSLRGPTGDILPRLLEAVRKHRAAGKGRSQE
jgi:NAD-dependent deacetylase